MDVLKKPGIWTKDALFAKAQRYASIMLLQDRGDWQFGFWSALALEMLAKATLANISPVLVADGKDWNNLYYALGHNPSTGKYSPKSIDISEVLTRLEAVLPTFTREILNFCVTHMNRRNNELHSGDLPFDGLGTSAWLPMYFFACKVMLESMGENLELLFGDNEAKIAKTLIDSLQDDAAKSVNGTIKAHKTVWDGKSAAEKDILRKQSEIASTRHMGHRVSCPACDSVALIQGSPVGPPMVSIEEDLIVERQSMLPSSFECIACGLKILGFSKLSACNIGDSFTSTYSYDAAEYFAIEAPPYDGIEPDFNEY